MKHPKKRFLNEVVIGEKVTELLESKKLEKITPSTDISKFPKGYVPFFTTDDHKMYQGFRLKVNNKTRIMPEPDPILVYFHTAYLNYSKIEEVKKALVERTENTLGSEPAINELYEYFGVVSTVVLFLFTTIEATANRCIPSKYIFQKESNRKTESFNKEQIERYFSFEDKINLVFPDVTGKNFKANYGIKWQHINNLKELRDNIMHTKSVNQGDTSDFHNFRKAFDFDYEKTIHAVKDFCNYYLGKDLIADCDCNHNW